MGVRQSAGPRPFQILYDLEHIATEDLVFCGNVVPKFGPVWVDPRAECGHVVWAQINRHHFEAAWAKVPDEVRGSYAHTLAEVGAGRPA